MYGSEVHVEPTEEATRLAARCGGWLVMWYQGSSRQKISELSGIEALLRWAASVFARFEAELRPIAEKILREALGEEVSLTWMAGEGWSGGTGAEFREWSPEVGERLGPGELLGYTDGGESGGSVGGMGLAPGGICDGNGRKTDRDSPTRLGIAGAWEESYNVVASDSQAAIRRCLNLTSGRQRAGSCVVSF